MGNDDKRNVNIATKRHFLVYKSAESSIPTSQPTKLAAWYLLHLNIFLKRSFQSRSDQCGCFLHTGLGLQGVSPYCKVLPPRNLGHSFIPLEELCPPPYLEHPQFSSGLMNGAQSKSDLHSKTWDLFISQHRPWCQITEIWLAGQVGRQVIALDLSLACRYKVATWFDWFIGQRLAAASRAVLISKLDHLP